MKTVKATARGFTLIELLVTLGLVGLVASVSLPLFEVTSTRIREAELRQALRTIRTALDAYKAASDTGDIHKEAGESGYPPSLDRLTEVIDIGARTDSIVVSADPPKRIQILRQLPRDPFFPDPSVPAAQTWNVRAYASRSDDPQPGPDVYDVSSKSQRNGLDGTPYAAW